MSAVWRRERLGRRPQIISEVVEKVRTLTRHLVRVRVRVRVGSVRVRMS